MSAFVGALCDKRYEMLYMTGTPAKGEVAFAEEFFAEIYSEYAERIVGSEMGVYENMKRLALSLAAVRIFEASILLAMDNGIDEETSKLLRKYGVRVCDDAEMNVTVLSSLLHKAVRKYKEAAEKYNEQMSKEGKQDREYFMSLLASMSSHFKFPITITGITAGDFCGMYNQMKSELKAAKSKKTRKS